MAIKAIDCSKLSPICCKGRPSEPIFLSKSPIPAPLTRLAAKNWSIIKVPSPAFFPQTLMTEAAALAASALFAPLNREASSTVLDIAVNVVPVSLALPLSVPITLAISFRFCGTCPPSSRKDATIPFIWPGPAIDAARSVPTAVLNSLAAASDRSCSWPRRPPAVLAADESIFFRSSGRF
ncbi:hypothetical protein D3C81_919450 [compost metagenome]